MFEKEKKKETQTVVTIRNTKPFGISFGVINGDHHYLTAMGTPGDTKEVPLNDYVAVYIKNKMVTETEERKEVKIEKPKPAPAPSRLRRGGILKGKVKPAEEDEDPED